MQVTLTQLQHIFPATKSTVLAAALPAINHTLQHYNINTKTRVASFLAQVGHESGGFNYMKENLNYSADGLVKTFPKYFNASTAVAYARKPDKIANKVYGGRMGNGPEATGDGSKFKGRGYIQITGRENYTNMAKHFGKDLDSAIAYLETPEGACMSAGWFWTTRGLNELADAGKFTQITQKINGGQNGAEDRKNIFTKALTHLVA